MLVSKELNFIFIHIYKNAGTSIRQSLLPLANFSMQKRIDSDLLLGVEPELYDLTPYPTHTSAMELVDYIGKSVFESYYSFAVARNPWDWQVSLYNFMYQHVEHPKHMEIRNIGGFDNYIKSQCLGRVVLQKSFICDEDGKLLVDRVLRFENINAEFSEVCHKIGVTVPLQHTNIFHHKNYRDYYNPCTIDLVDKAFREDIDFFGYEY